MQFPRTFDGIRGSNPVDTEIVVWIGEALASLSRARRFTGMLIGVPGRFGDVFQFDRDTIECGIGKLLFEALLESRLSSRGDGMPL